MIFHTWIGKINSAVFMQGNILQQKKKKKEWPIKPENTMDDLEC